MSLLDIKTIGWVQSLNPQRSCRFGRLNMDNGPHNDPWIVVVEREHVVSQFWLWEPKEYSLALACYRLMANQVSPYIEHERHQVNERASLYG